MNPEQLHKAPQDPNERFPPPVRRLGEKPTHKDCGCPASWTSVVKPSHDGVAIAVDPHTIASGPERDRISQQVQRIDGSGGIASYEDFGVVKSEGDLARSIAAVCLQMGIKILPDGSLQEPLFILPDSRPLLRWEIDRVPNNPSHSSEI